MELEKKEKFRKFKGLMNDFKSYRMYSNYSDAVACRINTQENLFIYLLHLVEKFQGKPRFVIS